MFLSNGRGLGRSLSYVGRSQISLFVMPHATLVHKSPYELFLEPLHATVVQKLPLNLFLKLSHGTVMQELPSKLFLKLLSGTVAQKLPCEAFSQGKTLIGIPGHCNVFLSNGRGLGRSLSYAGHSEIRPFMMLHGSVVHKLPFAAASVGLS